MKVILSYISIRERQPNETDTQRHTKGSYSVQSGYVLIMIISLQAKKKKVMYTGALLIM